MVTKFLRRTWSRYSKLGKRRKKKQVWRSPKGRDNKMREKRKGYPAVVSIGYRRGQKSRKTINEKKPILVRNIKDLNKISKKEIVVIGNIGKKKKIEIIKEAHKRNAEILNVNIKKFMKNIEEKEKKKIEEKNKLNEKTKKEKTKDKKLEEEDKSKEESK